MGKNMRAYVSLTIFFFYGIISPAISLGQASPTGLENFILKYFQQSQEAFSLIGIPAPNHCELSPTPSEKPGEPAPYLLHLPDQGPHLWPTCSFEELTFDCRIFDNPDPAIYYFGPSSVIGALPTGVLAPYFSRSTSHISAKKISHDMEAGISQQQLMVQLNLPRHNNAHPPLQRMQVLLKLFLDEEKTFFAEAHSNQSKKRVEVLSVDPRCALNPFFLTLEEDVLLICPVFSVLPNVVAASFFAQEIFKQASPEQQQEALAVLRPLPINTNEATAFQKWRLIQNLKTQGVRHLNSPELRLLTIYPEALYACAYQKSAGMPILPAQAAQGAEGQEALRQKQEIYKEAFQQWKTQINAVAKLPYAHEVLNCP